MQWLLDAQESDGSWFGRWGTNYVYGTGAVVPALVAAGVGRDSPPVRRAVRWLHGRQNVDGGWGEDLRSYDDPRGAGAVRRPRRRRPGRCSRCWPRRTIRGPSHRGAPWLVDTQQADGGWDEALYTGTGFPGDFYINYEMYRHVFPISALGRYARRFGQ